MAWPLLVILIVLFDDDDLLGVVVEEDFSSQPELVPSDWESEESGTIETLLGFDWWTLRASSCCNKDLILMTCWIHTCLFILKGKISTPDETRIKSIPQNQTDFPGKSCRSWQCSFLLVSFSLIFATHQNGWGEIWRRWVNYKNGKKPSSSRAMHGIPTKHPRKSRLCQDFSCPTRPMMTLGDLLFTLLLNGLLALQAVDSTLHHFY